MRWQLLNPGRTGEANIIYRINQQMKKEVIEAIGNFLSTYHSDLVYFQNFSRLKRGAISIEEYSNGGTGSFHSFLVEFKVIRNITKGSTDELLRETMKWIKGKNADDVDLFAQHLRQTGITRGQTMTSMASKVLLLNNPWKIMPLDSLARRTLNQTENRYIVYADNLLTFRKRNKSTIEMIIDTTAALTTVLESGFQGEMKDLKSIRRNRVTDKLLWTFGK